MNIIKPILQNVVGSTTTLLLLTEMRLESKKKIVVGISTIYPIFRDQKYLRHAWGSLDLLQLLQYIFIKYFLVFIM
jgi:hypothetical protein